MNIRVFPSEHMQKTRVTALVNYAILSPRSHMCPLSVPHALQPELLITKSGYITGECKQGRTFLSLNLT